MSRYGLNKYGEPTKYGKSLTSQDFLSEAFIAESVDYGAIRITWSPPNGYWGELKLIRNPYGFPTDTDDGVVIFDTVGTSVTSYLDSELVEGKEYYYSIFVFSVSDANWYQAGTVTGISVKNFNTYKYMWDALPLAIRSYSRNVLDSAGENKDFSDFIRIIAFAHDSIKTRSYLLYGIFNTPNTPKVLLPLLLSQLGESYEPSVGDKNLRVLARYLVELYKKKGSYDGLVQFIKAFSNYDCDVYIGKNLFLDYNDASFEESIGRWSCTTSNAELMHQTTSIYVNEDLTTPLRASGGMLVTPDTPGQDITVKAISGTPRLQGIPVSGNTSYVFSIKTMSESTSGEDVTASITWYDMFGKLLSTSYGSPTPDDIDEWTSVYVVDASPSDAKFAVPGITITESLYGHYFDAAQFEQGDAPSDVEDARLVKVYLRPSRINELPNPNFTTDMTGWATTNTAEVEIVNSSGTHPHSVLSGNAVELYPGVNTTPVTMYSDPITTITPGEYYTFSLFYSAAYYGDSESTEDGCRVNISWYDEEGDLLSQKSGKKRFFSRKLSNEWEVSDTVLRTDEIGVEVDTLKFKVGDNETPWNSLPYVTDKDKYVYYTSENWSEDFVLSSGHIGVETDTYKYKIGNGVSTWSELYYTTSIPAWVRVSATDVAPTDATHAVVSLIWDSIYSTESAIILDEALFEKSPFENSFFDGSVGQEDTQGLMWEGDPNNSRSWFYRNYLITNARLQNKIPEYLAMGSTFAIYYEAE